MSPAAKPSPVARAKPTASASATASSPAVRTTYPPDTRKGTDSKADPATVLDTPIIPKF